MFKRDWFDILPARPVCLQLVRYWDKAGTAGGDGARTAGVLMGRTPENQYVLLDVIKDRLSATDREKLILQTARLDGPTVTVWVEQEPGSGGKESAENTVRNLAGFTCMIERVTGAKEVRAEPLAAQAAVRNVKLVAAPWNGEFIGEAEVFPVGRLKDQIDAAAGAFNKICTPTGAWDASILPPLQVTAEEAEEPAISIGDYQMDFN
jgi:predicted phage terminase large subunit-like protein